MVEVPVAHARVAGYGRVSTEEQEEGWSLGAQREEVAAYCARYGLTLVRWEVDTISSEADETERAGLRRLVEAARASEIDLIVYAAQDRLVRDPSRLDALVALFGKYSVRLVDTHESPDTEENPTRQLLRTLMASVARFEKAMILSRTATGRRARIAHGHVPSGRAPFGYRYMPGLDGGLATYAPNPEQAAVVDRIFRRYAYGDADRITLYRIARELDADAIASPDDGVLWRETTIARIITNPAYRGTAMAYRWRFERPKKPRLAQSVKRMKRLRTAQIETDASEHVPIPVPPLVSDELWQAANARLASNRERLRRRPRRAYLLSGLLVHGACNRRMAGQQATKNSRIYRCHACGSGRGGMALDNAVWTAIAYALLTTEWKPPARAIRRLDRSRQAARLSADKAALRERQMGIDTLYADGRVDDERYELMAARVTKKVTEVEQRLADLSQQMLSEAHDKSRYENVFRNQDYIEEWVRLQCRTASSPRAIRELLSLTVDRVVLEEPGLTIFTTAVLGYRPLEVVNYRTEVAEGVAPYRDTDWWLRRVEPETPYASEEERRAEHERWDETMRLYLLAMLAPERLDPDQSYFLDLAGFVAADTAERVI